MVDVYRLTCGLILEGRARNVQRGSKVEYIVISGMDHVFLAQGPVPVAVERFLGAWLRRWPGLRCASGADGSDGTFSPWTPGLTGTSADAGSLLIARDQEMEANWDTFGYVLDERGEGPLALAYEPVNWQSLPMTPQKDPYGRAGFRYEPYDIKVVGAGLHLVTVVTPDDSVFTRVVLDTLLLSFAPAALHP